MLPEQPLEPRILSPEEKSEFLATASSKPQWLVAYCAAVVALNTTMRGCELKGLHWKNVDLFEKVLRIRRQSTTTDAGARGTPLAMPWLPRGSSGIAAAMSVLRNPSTSYFPLAKVGASTRQDP